MTETSNPLLDRAKLLHKVAYKKASWNRDVYKKRTGHFLQAFFGKGVWYLGDLNDEQLQKVIEICEERITRKGYTIPDVSHE